MTQIISVVTKDYVLLASDRRLTIGEGPRQGEIFDDDTCKLVSLCNICGIGYTGLAHIEGQPTHEWIAKTLAANNCHDPGLASQVILREANRAFSHIKSPIKYQTFFITGWAQFENKPGIRSHFCAITNALDDHGKYLTKPKDKFDLRIKSLPDEKDYLWSSIGQPIHKDRAKNLERNIRMLVQRNIGPKELLRILAEEIIYTSVDEKNITVGQKILGLCIPKKSAELQSDNRRFSMVSKQPDLDSSTFTYFENGYSELRQFGPTIVCGETALTNLMTENDAKSNRQWAEVKILHLPRKSS